MSRSLASLSVLSLILCCAPMVPVLGVDWEHGMGGDDSSRPTSARDTRADVAARLPIEPDGNEPLTRRETGLRAHSSQLDDYEIGAGDVLEVEVFNVPELFQTLRVNARGYIKMPLAGAIKAEGLSEDQLAELIAKRLGEDYLVDPQVSVFIKEYASHYTLEGLVQKTGMFPLTGPTTVLEAIAQAGGLSEVAKSNEIALYRRDEDGRLQEHAFDYDEIRENLAEDFVLEPDDVIIVNPSMAKIAWRRLLGIISLGTLSPYGYTAPGR